MLIAAKMERSGQIYRFENYSEGKTEVLFCFGFVFFGGTRV
jgi:hypothetical protein